MYDAEKRRDYFEMRLAFDKYVIDEETGKVDESKLYSGEMDQVVYDILRFVYEWNEGGVGEKRGWQCIDSYAASLSGDPSDKPGLFVEIGNFV